MVVPLTSASLPASHISPGSGYPKVLIALLGVGLVLGLGASGMVWWRRR